MLSNHLILCHSLLLLPSIFPSIRVFSGKPVLHIGWPKYCTPYLFIICQAQNQQHQSLSLGNCKLLSTYLRGDKKTVKLALGPPTIGDMGLLHCLSQPRESYVSTTRTLFPSRQVLTVEFDSLVSFLSKIIIFLLKLRYFSAMSIFPR